jgi:hypothetical protein
VSDDKRGRAAADPPEPSPELVRPFLGHRLFAEPDADEEHGSALRPFLLTSGRVPSPQAIAIETQVISTEYGFGARENLAFECRDIVALCSVPLSVAEIAARLSLHLGVVRVLVGDLSGEGYLYAYLPNADASQDVDTLLRVIHGLRAIS